MAINLNFSLGTFEKYSDLSKETGTVYFATDTDGRTYIYLNSSNVVPKLLDLRNGGLGANLTAAKANAVYLRGSGDYNSTYVDAAEGAFYTLVSENVVQKPQFGTLPVKVGGTGKTSIGKGAILYGNTLSTTDALETLSPTTNGYVLVSTGEEKAPAYVKPTMDWTNNEESDIAGPIFTFKFNDTSIAGVAIPAATDLVSGIVTTGTQTMKGEKTWISTMNASTIYPRTSGTYSLGSTSMLWNGLHIRQITVYDDNKVKNIGITTSTGTSTAQGLGTLTLGNAIQSGASGNAQGEIYLYSSSSGYSNIKYTNSTSNVSHTLPAVSGSIVIAKTSVYNSTTPYQKYVPFMIGTSSNDMQIGYNDGFQYYGKQGTTDAEGYGALILGNYIGYGSANNKTGRLTLCARTADGSAWLMPNRDNDSSTSMIYLPAASGELVYHTENSAQGGSGRLISVSVDGQITADITTDIAGTKQLMYLADGLLTASAATEGGTKQFVYLNQGILTKTTETVGSGTKLMYMSSGVLTESAGNVANGKKQLMYLSNGVLTGSDASEGNNTKFVYLKNGVVTASTANVGANTQLMYLSAGTFTPSTADVGSTTQPVYLLDGVITPANDYTTLLTAFSGSSSASDNTASITVGGTTKTATIIGGVSNTWASGTSSGPTITTTVNGITGTAVTIPSASYSASGVVTTAAQTLKGVKTFAEGIKISNGNSTTDCATLTYDGNTLTISFG